MIAGTAQAAPGHGFTACWMARRTTCPPKRSLQNCSNSSPPEQRRNLLKETGATEPRNVEDVCYFLFVADGEFCLRPGRKVDAPCCVASAGGGAGGDQGGAAGEVVRVLAPAQG